MPDPRKIYPLDISEFAPPQRDPAEDEREALAWLDGIRSGLRADLNRATSHAAVLRRLLAQPRLPEDPSGEALTAIYGAIFDAKSPNKCRAVYRALHAHLTGPKTKPMWLVSWVDKWDKLHEFYLDSLEIALPNYRGAVNNVHYHDAKLSGPHERPVPAD